MEEVDWGGLGQGGGHDVVVGDASRSSTGPQFSQFIFTSCSQCNITPAIQTLTTGCFKKNYLLEI